MVIDVGRSAGDRVARRGAVTGGSQRRPLSRRERPGPTRTPLGRRPPADSGADNAPLPAKRMMCWSSTRPETVAFTAERRAQARLALRVLYGDFLAGGGLDIVRAARCPEAPTEEPEP